MDVALATCSALPGLAPDDRLLLDALRTRGVDAEPAVWEDRHYGWEDVALCVVRSTWDYAFRRDAFLEWARRASAVTTLWNSLDVIEWNTHKRYLVDLAARGVPVVPTVMLEAGSTVRLGTLLAEWGWRDAVVKAAVAQTGRYLKRIQAGSVSEGQRHLDRLLPHEDMLLQPFLEAVATAGEISLTFVDGTFSHAVRKRAVRGDYRVHDDYGGSVTPETPTDDEMSVARSALRAVPHPLLYARVDLVPDGAGSPVVMELELVEPDLFFRGASGSAGRLAEAIAGRLAGRRAERAG